MNVMKSTLGLILAGGLLMAGTAATALADGHGHGDDHGNQQQQQQQNNPYQYGQYGNQNNNGGDDNNGRGEQENGNQNAHNCVNPAGKERGWCKHNGYNNNQNGYYGNNQNAQLHGIITGVSGDTVSILQGLTTISFDATAAIQRNNVNGSLYPTRSITAYGYWDNNHYFHANAIR
ncbi:MAG TPA: hypothetical protein VMW12_08375 [Candidatus Dormibacteraeota bacterium]|nr:hypothetical protein [Candidatus Dormibacteraeota bacterium]